jgi:hypothetical protein
VTQVFKGAKGGVDFTGGAFSSAGAAAIDLRLAVVEFTISAMVRHANIGVSIQAKEQPDIVRANRIPTLVVVLAQPNPWRTTTVFRAEPCHIGLIAISGTPRFDANAHAFF